MWFFKLPFRYFLHRTQKLSSSTEQSLSWEVDIALIYLRNCPPYMEPEVLLVFTKVHHRPVFWATWIQSIPSRIISLRFHFNIVFPSTPRFSVWSRPFRLLNQDLVCICHHSHACYMLRPSHPHPNYISWTVGYKLWSSTLYTGPSWRNGSPGGLRGASLAPHSKSMFIKANFFVFYHFIILTKSVNSVVRDWCFLFG
jgi:hypothetical protein